MTDRDNISYISLSALAPCKSQNLKSFFLAKSPLMTRHSHISKSSHYLITPAEHFNLRMQAYMRFLEPPKAEWEAKPLVFKVLSLGIIFWVKSQSHFEVHFQ